MSTGPARGSREAAVASARDALGANADAGASLLDAFDEKAFAAAFELVEARRARGGRLHVTGVGKPEHLARYAASLLSSTGTPAYFLHATETLHGSGGQIQRDDVVIAISNSGTTQELLQATALAREVGAALIAVVGAPDSALAREADVVLDAGVAREGGALGLAPRASAAAELAVLAAFSAGLEALCGWTREDYHRHHPAGALGKKSAS